MLVAASLGAAMTLVQGDAVASASPIQMMSGLPISFERNEGQFRPDVLYVARGVAGEVAVRYGDITVSPRPVVERDGRKLRATQRAGSLRLSLAGANPAPTVEAIEPKTTVSHHYQGAVRRENVPHFGQVVMRDVYTHIDLAVHGRQGELEYDFVLSPGADPRDIRLRLDADRVEIDGNGDLLMFMGEHALRQHAPVAYQDVNGDRMPVAARFELEQGPGAPLARFVVGDYDRSQPLVIDPVLGYSTYFGGSGDESGAIVQVDPNDNAYIAYTTYSLGASGSWDVNVTKFHSRTNTHHFTTTLHSSSQGAVNALAIGASGGSYASYLGGWTQGSDFPHCYLGGDCAAFGGIEDGFVTVLRPNGTISASRFLGGAREEQVSGLALQGGNIFIAGDTNSGNFPTTGSTLYPTKIGGSATIDFDGFAAKLTPNLTMIYGTYLGGFSQDNATGIAVDASGNAYVTGNTDSSGFPTLNAFNTVGRVFVSELNPTASAFVYSTRLGASLGASGLLGPDSAKAIAYDPNYNRVTILGQTYNPNFPTAGAPQPTYGGNGDAFVARVNSYVIGGSGATYPYLEFATFVGGAGTETPGGLAVNTSLGTGVTSDYWISGTTTSSNFPIVAATQSTPRGGSEAFVTHYTNDVPVFSTYLGGSADDYANGIALGASGSVYVAGRTESTNFPLVNAYKTSKTGSSDLFLSRFDPIPPGAARYDWDGEGHPDILFRNSATGATYSWRMNGTSLFADQFVTSIDPSWRLIGHGDFDGDNKNDMVWRHDATGATYVWYMNNGVFQNDAFLFTIDPIWKIEAVADFNRDGKPDFLFRHQGTGLGFLWYYNNTTQLSDQYLYSIDTSWIVENVGDFNGDGYPDFFFRSLTSGLGFVWYWNGSSLVGSNALFTIDPAWQVVQIADWNRDGVVDLLFRNSGSGVVFVWYTNGTSLQGSDLLFQIDPLWRIVPYR